MFKFGIYGPDSQARCPLCKSLDVKPREKYEGKRGRITKYYCQHCDHKFVYGPLLGTHFPEWAVNMVLTLIVLGVRPKAIADALKRGSFGVKIEISAQTVQNMINRAVKLLLRFETLVERKEPSPEWIIDDAFVSLPLPLRNKTGAFHVECPGCKYKWTEQTMERTITCPNCGREIRKLRSWIIVIQDLGTKYILTTYLSLGCRTSGATRDAMKLAMERAKGIPICIKSDSLQSQILGIKEFCPHINIIAKTKRRYYSWINEIEGLISYIRRAGISRRGSRSPESLQNRLGLLRFDYNFLKPHSSLGGETPAMVAGIVYPEVSTWFELISFAYSYINSRGVSGR